MHLDTGMGFLSLIFNHAWLCLGLGYFTVKLIHILTSWSYVDVGTMYGALYTISVLLSDVLPDQLVNAIGYVFIGAGISLLFGKCIANTISHTSTFIIQVSVADKEGNNTYVEYTPGKHLIYTNDNNTTLESDKNGYSETGYDGDIDEYVN